jgi:hypothetical protein
MSEGNQCNGQSNSASTESPEDRRDEQVKHRVEHSGRVRIRAAGNTSLYLGFSLQYGPVSGWSYNLS